MPTRERMVFADYGSKEATREAQRRRQDEFRISVDTDEFEADEKYYKDKHNTILRDDPDVKEIERQKPSGEIFEDRVWTMFYQLHALALPIRRTIIEYQKGLTKQIDGLFADEDHVYLVECKYRDRKGGQLVKDNSLRNELQQWRGILPLISKRLESFDIFRGKQVHFLLATRGIDMEGTVGEEGRGWVDYIDDTVIGQLIDLAAKMGQGARAVLHQHLFKGQDVPGKPRIVHAIRTRHGSRVIYSFFANADELMDLAYVHRRAPSNVDLSTSYQRFVRPEKVAKISEYLTLPGSFFPNSIVVAIDEATFEPFGNPTDVATWGKLTLPKKYASIWIIDGQHRLFGSAALEENRSKYFPVIAIQGLSPQEQGELFRVINVTQTKIPPDLIWDIAGDVGGEREPVNDAEREGYRKRVISRVWKRVNESKSHPMGGKIVIPSQTIKSKECFIQFAYLCDMLDFHDLWTEGRLRGESWSSAENYCYNRLSKFIEGLATNLREEWHEGKGGWLLSQYSLRVILQVFRHAVLMFSGPRYERDWKAREGPLIEKFTTKLSEAIVSPNVDYGRQIRKAGNAVLRQEMVKLLVRELREDYPDLAPTLGTQEAEDTGDEPSPQVHYRSRELERHFRDCVYSVLYRAQGANWYNKIPEKQRKSIEEDVSLRRAHGEDGLPMRPGRDWLDSTTLSDMKEIIVDEKNWPLFKDYLGGVKKTFEDYFDDFKLLRNLVAHGKSYPSKEARLRWVAALSHLEKLSDRWPEPPEAEPGGSR